MANPNLYEDNKGKVTKESASDTIVVYLDYNKLQEPRNKETMELIPLSELCANAEKYVIEYHVSNWYMIAPFQSKRQDLASFAIIDGLLSPAVVRGLQITPLSVSVTTYTLTK